MKEDYEVIPILRSLLTDNPPSPGKVGHTTGAYIPSLLPFFLFEQKYKDGLDEQDLTHSTPIEKGTKLDYKPLLRKMSPVPLIFLGSRRIKDRTSETEKKRSLEKDSGSKNDYTGPSNKRCFRLQVFASSSWH